MNARRDRLQPPGLALARFRLRTESSEFSARLREKIVELQKATAGTAGDCP